VANIPGHDCIILPDTGQAKIYSSIAESELPEHFVNSLSYEEDCTLQQDIIENPMLQFLAFFALGLLILLSCIGCYFCRKYRKLKYKYERLENEQEERRANSSAGGRRNQMDTSTSGPKRVDLKTE